MWSQTRVSASRAQEAASSRQEGGGGRQWLCFGSSWTLAWISYNETSHSNHKQKMSFTCHNCMHFLLPLTRNSWPSTLDSPFGFCSREIQWCISSGVSLLQCITRFAVMITKEFGLPESKSIRNQSYSYKYLKSQHTQSHVLWLSIGNAERFLEYKLQRSEETPKSIPCAVGLQTDECRVQTNRIKHFPKPISKDYNTFIS